MTGDLFAAAVSDSGAVFSPCRRWRTHLHRRWASGPSAVFLGMNPSAADEVDNDPTIERFYRRVRGWEQAGLFQAMGLQIPGAVEVVNVFSIVETHSDGLAGFIRDGVDIVGPNNDYAILTACRPACLVVCGWGKPGHQLLGRGPRVLAMLQQHEVALHCLGVNADGSPQHPLYIGYSRALQRYPVPHPA